MQPPPTWDPQQYLRHAGHRTRPFPDLLARVPELPGGSAPASPTSAAAPATSPSLLADRWPAARITGYDNSAGDARRGPTSTRAPPPAAAGSTSAHADAHRLDARGAVRPDRLQRRAPVGAGDFASAQTCQPRAVGPAIAKRLLLC